MKIAIFLNMVYGSNSIPIAIIAGFFEQSDNLILKFTWKYKGPRILKTIWKNWAIHTC